MSSFITILIQFPLKFYFNILYYFNYIFFYFSLRSLPFILKEEMYYNNIEENNSFFQSENGSFLQSLEIESSDNIIGSFSRDVDILRTSTTKNRSFIWNYCEKLSDGWRCIVKKQNGEQCNYFFSYNTNRGSTSNTISHLRQEHGIIREEVIKKVFHNFV